MKAKAIDEKAYEVMEKHFEAFVKEIEQLCKGLSMSKKWMNNQDVCMLLQISKRTLQHYRDNRVIPFSRLGNKCYYKASDIEQLLSKSKNK
jgi:phosphoenolpyruvate carboxylase